MSAKINYAIPDIDLPLPKGGTVNPSDFAGHELVVLFCPLDPVAAAQEVADYDRLGDQLSYNDAWMIAICDDTKSLPATRMMLAADPDLAAWKAFCENLEPPEQVLRKDGAVFLFGRGGCLTRAWQGPGHADEVVSELGKRM